MRFTPHVTTHGDRVLLTPAFERLLLVLEGVEPKETSLSVAVRGILRPLQQLDEGFRLAEAVLGDDHIAMHHLRLFLAANSDWEALFDAMVATLDDSVDLNHYGSGLIHEGALIALAIAVHRVAKTFGLPGVLKIPFGIAIACGVAESLVRLGPDALRGPQLEPLLRSLAHEGDGGLKGLLSGLISDRAERARWKLLHMVYRAVAQGLFSQACLDGVKEAWDSAWAGDAVSAIDAVLPIDAEPDHMVRFHIVPGDDFDFNRAIFASPGHESRFVSKPQDPDNKDRFWWDPSNNDLHVKVPKSATWGWVGLTRVKPGANRPIDEYRQATNAFRRKLHELLAVSDDAPPFPFNIPPGANDEPPVASVFRRHPVPIHLLPTKAADSVPPFLGPNRFHGGLPRVSHLTFIDRSETAATASWDTAGADRVKVERVQQPEGTVELLEDTGPPCGRLTVEADWNGEVRVRVTPYRAALEGEEAEISTRVGPRPVHQAVVLFRPVVFHSDNTRHQAAEGVSQRLRGLEFDVVDGLPWVSDELAVAAGPIADGHDSRAAAILDGLRRAALVSPGGESALWVAVLPDPDSNGDGAGWYRWSPATAAFAVAVTTERQLETLVRELLHAGWARDVPLTRRCLRVLGTVSGSRLQIESVREEARPWAPGSNGDRASDSDAGEPVSFEWHLFDGRGSRVATLPAAISHDRSPSLVSALVPIDPNTHAVELRRVIAHHSVPLHTIYRPVGAPAITFNALTYDSGAHTGAAAWAYEHTNASMPTLVLELLRGPIWTAAVELPPCVVEVALPMQRLGSFDSARISACDGWNQAIAELPDADPISNDSAAAIRRLDDGRIATEWEGPVRWYLNGELMRVNPDDPASAPLLTAVIDAPPEGVLRLAWGERTQGGWKVVGTDTLRVTRRYR
ncbi:hypothetical protein [Haliangium sp.]|uniref:hypothetical protein n=1 Tax=Haliangium sp. TaxID=2663208 RepID=UPI003D11D996